MKRSSNSRAKAITLPPWVGVAGEALLTTLGVAAFFAILWAAWFLVAALG